MKKILESYGFRIIQDCFGLLNFLEKEDIKFNEFKAFIKFTKNKIETDNGKCEKERDSFYQKKNLKLKGAVAKSRSFLQSGEIEKMGGVRCEKCHGEIYIEGICPSNPLVKKGYVRRGICGTCGIEFGIR